MQFVINVKEGQNRRKGFSPVGWREEGDRDSCDGGWTAPGMIALMFPAAILMPAAAHGEKVRRNYPESSQEAGERSSGYIPVSKD